MSSAFIFADHDADDFPEDVPATKQPPARAEEQGVILDQLPPQEWMNPLGRLKHDECPLARESDSTSVKTSMSLLFHGLSTANVSGMSWAEFDSKRESLTSCGSGILPPATSRNSGSIDRFLLEDTSITVAEQARNKPPTPTKSNKRLQVASKAKRSRKASKKKTKSEKAESAKRGHQIRSLIEKCGEQHVYFGRGEPICNNPGNIRFREIVNAHYDDFFLAPDKKGKAKIRDDIEKEVKKDERNGNSVKFFSFQVGKEGMFLKSATEKKISDHIGHTLRDTPERRATYWSWALETKQQWMPFDANTGEKLERMYQTERLNLATKKKDITKTGLVVPVIIVNNVRHFADMTHPMRVNMSGPSQEEHGPLVYKVRRKPLTKKDWDGTRDDSGAVCTVRTGTSSSSGSSSSADQPSSPGTLRGSQQQGSPSSSYVAFAALSADSLTRVQEPNKNDKDDDAMFFAAISDEIGQNIEFYSTQRGDIENRQFPRQKASAELLVLHQKKKPSSPALMSNLTEGLGALELRNGRPGGTSSGTTGGVEAASHPSKL